MRKINLIDYFSIQDLKGSESYELLKDISDIIGEKKIAELIDLHGGTRFYIPNLRSIPEVKKRCINQNKDLSIREIARELNLSYDVVYKYKE